MKERVINLCNTAKNPKTFATTASFDLDMLASLPVVFFNSIHSYPRRIITTVDRNTLTKYTNHEAFTKDLRDSQAPLYVLLQQNSIDGLYEPIHWNKDKETLRNTIIQELRKWHLSTSALNTNTLIHLIAQAKDQWPKNLFSHSTPILPTISSIKIRPQNSRTSVTIEYQYSAIEQQDCTYFLMETEDGRKPQAILHESTQIPDTTPILTLAFECIPYEQIPGTIKTGLKSAKVTILYNCFEGYLQKDMQTWPQELTTNTGRPAEKSQGSFHNYHDNPLHQATSEKAKNASEPTSIATAVSSEKQTPSYWPLGLLLLFLLLGTGCSTYLWYTQARMLTLALSLIVPGTAIIGLTIESFRLSQKTQVITPAEAVAANSLNNQATTYADLYLNTDFEEVTVDLTRVHGQHVNTT